jgi:hypothetical protein
MKKLLLLLLLPTFVQAQYIKQATTNGVKVIRYPEYTVTNTLVNVGVEKSLLPTPDTIYASTASVGSRFSGTLLINVTTPVLSIGNMTIKIKGGTGLGSVLTLTNGLALNGGATNVPIVINWTLEVKSMTSQLLNAQIIQNNGIVIPINLTNMTPQAVWSLDMTQQNYFDITVTFTGVTLGTTSYVSKVYRRILE